MVEKFPAEKWAYGLYKDMQGNDGRLNERGLVTKMTIFPGSKENRPLALRMRRAKFVNDVFDLREDYGKGEISEEEYQQKISALENELKNNDEIYFNFLNRVRPISVDMGKLGVQEANYVDLSFSETDLTKPPIVFIPGISNDVNGSGEFALELALSSKRRVIMITYPESPQGKVSKQFPKAVFKSHNFGPHVEFFMGAINQVLGNDSKFDFASVSAGGIFVTEISKKKEMTDRIGKINIIVPPGMTGIRPLEVKKRLEMNNSSMQEMEKDGSVGRLMVINPKILDRSKEDIKNSGWAFKFLALKLTQEYKWWKGVDKKTRVIIAKSDGITDGIDNLDKLKSNLNLSVELVDGGHEVPAVRPEAVIEKMII